jgi:hypothetical protein
VRRRGAARSFRRRAPAASHHSGEGSKIERRVLLTARDDGDQCLRATSTTHLFFFPNRHNYQEVSGLGTDVSSQVGGSVNPRTLQTYPVRTTFTRSRTSVVKPGGMGSRRRMRSTDEVTTTSTTATTATVIILTHVEKGIWIAVRF